jgi:hypothetical protein
MKEESSPASGVLRDPPSGRVLSVTNLPSKPVGPVLVLNQNGS